MPESSKTTLSELAERFKIEGEKALSRLYFDQEHFLLIFPSNTNLNPSVWTATSPTLTAGNTSIIRRSSAGIMTSFEPSTVVQPVKKSNRNNEKFISVGRDKIADIRLTSKQVSKLHSVFYIENKRLIIKDLHSTNGLLINEVPSTSAILESLTEIQFADTKTLYLNKKDLINLLQTVSAQTYTESEI